MPLAIALEYNPNAGEGDVAVAGRELKKANRLQTLVYTSLFCDAYADASVLPGFVLDRRGFWGDAFLGAGVSHGSHLWLLNREKITQTVINQARNYAEQALRWLVADGLAVSIGVTAERYDLTTIALHITVTEPDGTTETFDFVA